MHHVLLPLANVLNETVIFKRYIDDIILLFYDYSSITKIKELLHDQLDDFNIPLVFNSINTEKTDNELEFFDVLHVASLNAKVLFLEIL